MTREIGSVARFGTMSPSRVVHLELHTHDLEAASAFYCELLQWRAEQIDSPWGSYHALLLGDGLDSGIVACGTRRAGWLPYVEIDRIEAATDRARCLGASVLLGPREGPAGWRSVVSTPAGGEIALWQHTAQSAPGTRCLPPARAHDVRSAATTLASPLSP